MFCTGPFTRSGLLSQNLYAQIFLLVECSSEGYHIFHILLSFRKTVQYRSNEERRSTGHMECGKSS